MAIKYAPSPGTILLCNFDGYIPPEMNKKRPVVVLSTVSHRLCIVVPLSTTEPSPQESWHYLLNTPEPLPPPYNSLHHWVKGDMVSTVSYMRLSLPHAGKDADRKRNYGTKYVALEELKRIRACVVAAIS
jgi:uncharacterized protein YifN (PemK superfamily)